MKRPCLDCGTLTPASRCPDCQRTVEAQRRARRRSTGQGYGRPYTRLRLAVLDRDGYRCHWCGGPAATVDHLLPVSKGGADSADNLVAACTRCNYRRGARPGPPP
ncbi:MAG: HNH endonuclease [Acidimicrobiales bacterium]|nr:HNH endonuclease [Acidimicrobiales bacterium]